MFNKFAKFVDNFFEEIRYMITLIVFFNISMAVFLFIYWLVFSAKLTLPYWLEIFVWNMIDFWARGIKNTPIYQEITPILPVLVSGVFIVLTYFLNCFIVFLESNHEKFNKSVDNYKQTLAKKINDELRHDFHNELKKNSYSLLKIKIVAIRHTSYLSEYTDEAIDTDKLEQLLHNKILESLNSDYIEFKGCSNGSLYFILNNVEETKEFIVNLVTISSRLINEAMKPKLELSFYCAVDLIASLADAPSQQEYLDRVLNIKIKNKIIATPKFKLYFETLYPSVYHFDVLGQYNIETETGGKPTSVIVYALRRKC